MILARMAGGAARPESIPLADGLPPVLSRYTNCLNGAGGGGHYQDRRGVDGPALDRHAGRGLVPATATPRLLLVRAVSPRCPDRRPADAPRAKASRCGELVVRPARREGLLLAELLAVQGADAKPLEVRSCPGTGLPDLPLLPGSPVDRPERPLRPRCGDPGLSGRGHAPDLSRRPRRPGAGDRRTVAASGIKRDGLAADRNGRSDPVVSAPRGPVPQGDFHRLRSVSARLHDRLERYGKLRLQQEHHSLEECLRHLRLSSAVGLLDPGGLGAGGRSGGGAGSRPGPRATDELARGRQAPCSG